MSNNYKPNPINTTDIELTPDLELLVEKLAENAHNIWAEKRILEGWVWGPKRCDLKLHHPCLISYEQLPELEKNYDRAAVVSTLKSILALGFKITNCT